MNLAASPTEPLAHDPSGGCLGISLLPHSPTRDGSAPARVLSSQAPVYSSYQETWPRANRNTRACDVQPWSEHLTHATHFIV